MDSATDETRNSVSDETHASVARSTALMSIATLGSRVTGLVRTWAMAFALGNTMITGSYQVANSMPNVVFDLVAGGLLGAAFIPVFMLEREQKGPDGGNSFACNLLNLTVIVLGLLSLISSIFAPQLIATQTFTRSDSAEVVSTAILLFRIFAFQIVFYGISGIVTGILNANRVYFLPALAPALNNVCVIVSFFLYIPISATDPHLAVVILGIGATLGVAVQAVIQIPALIKQGFHWTPRVDLKDPALMEALRIALPTMLYILGTLVAFSCRTAFSLAVGDNGPSTWQYAWTWYQLPYGVIAVSLSRALFTEMGEASAKEDWPAMRELVRTGLSGNLLLIIPMAGWMFVLASPIMELFQAGAFSACDVGYVSDVLKYWVVSLPFYAVLMFLYNVYAALRKFLRFAVVSTLLVVVQCALYFAMCRPDGLGLLGIPLADFVYYAVCSIVLALMLRKMIGAYDLGSVIWLAARTFVATLIAGAAALLLARALPVGAGMLAGLIRLVVCGGVGLVIAFGLCTVFRIPEMHYVTDIVNKLKSKLGK
ncbi:MAG: murein biosynthesis integral membrane protein MurJ [Eggerthellaceae bacterium]|nr:murein biosynthesis integral membrane protein MurJ [Eggerthellaceae bacterium]